MNKSHSQPALMAAIANMLLCSALLALGLACGSGGGSAGAGDASTSSGKGVKMMLKPEHLYKVANGDEITIVEIGGERRVALKRTALSENLARELEVEFELDRTYAVVVYSHGVPFVRTTVFASQLNEAKTTGVLKIGSINAITTYFTGLLEVEVNGSRSATGKGADVEATAKAILAKNFTSGVATFSDLTYANVVGGLAKSTDGFRLRMNRINTLTMYLEWVGSLSSVPTSSQVAAMGELFAAIFDENNATNLLSKLASPALPAKPVKTDPATGVASQAYFMQTLNQSGLFLRQEGVLASTDLAALFFEPGKNAQLALVALESPDAILSGVVAGSLKSGIVLDLRQKDASDPLMAIQKSVVSAGDGSFFFNNLPAGTYEVTPQKQGYVFNPASQTVSLSKSQRKAGFNFDSFLYIQGSPSVPLEKNVLSGIQYTSSDGSTSLTGKLLLPQASFAGETRIPGGLILQYQ